MATTTNVIRGGITINEILYNPGGGNFDTTSNGVISDVEDEFIEIYNTSSSDIDISGLQIYDNEERFFTFPSGTTLEAGKFAVVVANATVNGGSLPAVSDGNLAFNAARTNNTFINNEGDMLALYDPNTNNYIQVNYGSSTGRSVAVPSGATLLSVESWGSLDGTGVSIARNPDGDTQISLQNRFGSEADATPAASNNLIADTTTPTIISSAPADDDTGVAVDGNLVINFSENVVAGTGNIVIRNADGTSFETISVTDTRVTINGDTLTINPSGDLANSAGYYVEIEDTAILDPSGNKFAGISGDSTFNFTTVAPDDTTAPTIVSSAPADDDTGVAVDGNLVINFSEDVVAGTGNIVIRNADGTSFETIPVTDPRVTINGDTLTINPSGDLANSAGYYVEIEDTAILDPSGNKLAGISGDSTFNFTTVAPDDTTNPTIISSAPADDDTGVAVDGNLVINFSENVVAGTGNIVIRNADGTSFETISVTDTRVTINGDTLTINPSGDLANSAGYYVEIEDTAILDPSGNSFAGISGDSTFNFTTVAPDDTTAPTIISSAPADDDTGVAVDGNLVITFSENIVAGTGNIVIRNADGTSFETISVTDTRVTINGDTLTINPSGNLANSAGYYVEIDPTAIEDTSGNSFAGISGDSTFNFTTVAAPATTVLPDLIQLVPNNTFLINRDPSREVNLKATLSSTDATFNNEVSVFNTLDSVGTISDENGIFLVPDDGDAYVQAALKQSKVLFSNVANKPKGFDGTEQSRNVSGFNSGDQLGFFLVSNGTVDQVLNGEISEDQVIFGATSDAFKPVQITDKGSSEFSLSWEDQVGGGDESFDDLVLDIKLTDDAAPLGNNLQGGNYAEVIDLRGVTQATLDFSVFRDAAFNNEVYFYEVENANGEVDSLAPNAAPYMQAAINNIVKDENGNALKFAANDRGVETGSATIMGGSIIAPMIIIDGSLNQLLDADMSNDPTVYFPYIGANSDGADHIKLLGDNTFGFEDLANGGDKDFNDLVIKIDSIA